jgi:hypothetical protein
MMTLGAETKIYAVQIQNCRYYDPAAPWETVLCTHSEDAALECADGNAGHGVQARVLRYDVQCRVLRLYRLTQDEEDRAKAVADAIARAHRADDNGEVVDA